MVVDHGECEVLVELRSEVIFLVASGELEKKAEHLAESAEAERAVLVLGASLEHGDDLICEVFSQLKLVGVKHPEVDDESNSSCPLLWRVLAIVVTLAHCELDPLVQKTMLQQLGICFFVLVDQMNEVIHYRGVL